MSASTRVAFCPTWCNQTDETHHLNIHASDWDGPADDDGDWHALSRAVEDGINGDTTVELEVTDFTGTEITLTLTPDQADELALSLKTSAIEARE